jgi:putative ABC transport system permease protein
MRLLDSLSISGGNLTRLKLRTSLTIAGVVIAIATFVAMLSFGAGNQRYVEEQFEKLGLFNTVQVYPISAEPETDSVPPRGLDRAALEELSKLPGVRLAYPFEAFTATATLGDSIFETRAQALSQDALQTKLFSGLQAGRLLASDSAKEAVVTDRLLRAAGMIKADSVLNQPIVLRVRISSVDSGLARVLPPDREYMQKRIREIQFDSLLHRAYTERLLKAELNKAMSEFLKGYMQSPNIVSETLTIVGVLHASGPQERNISSVIVPEATGRRLTAGIFSGDPTEMMAALSSGQLFMATEQGDGRTFGHVTLDLDPKALVKPVIDSVKALGFRPFSFAEQFEEIKKFFFYFDLALAVVGIIALVTASLGIINTMVMSVLERRREIGVLKSLGANERDIKFLFLTESAVIGLAGSFFGILFGWTITLVASKVAQVFMEREGIPAMQLFALPVWLVASALTLGLVVSLAAGYYPASRAARVDPVEALRNE